MEKKVKDFINLFGKIYFSELKGTEKGNELIRNKAIELNLNKDTCERIIKTFISKYQNFESELSDETSSSKKEICTIQEEPSHIDINLINDKNLRIHGNYEVYEYLTDTLVEELKDIYNDEIPNKYLTKDYVIYKDGERISNYKLTDINDVTIVDAKLSTSIDLERYKYNGYGNVYIENKYREYIIFEQGQYNNGKLCKGKTYIDGNLLEEGEFKDKVLLRGNRYLKNGQLSEQGEFKNKFLFRGKKYENEELIEEIEFKNYRDVSEFIYSGEKYINGELIEEGEFEHFYLINGKKYRDGKLSEEGKFSELGLMLVSGKMYRDGELSYDGEFEFMSIVEGRIYHKGELVFEGKYKDLMLDGYGKVYTNNKIYEEGEFKQGLLNGYGKRYDWLGNIVVEEGIYENGKLVKSYLKYNSFSSNSSSTNKYIIENQIQGLPELENWNTKDDIKCPNCGSIKLHTSNKRFSLGKAAVGHVIAGPLGLLGGLLGSNKIKLTCLNCKYSWKL